MKITIIVAIAENNAIGYQNDLLAFISADLKRFKQLTTGHPIIMGRKTFDSLPKGALPNRRNIVVSHQSNLELKGAEVVNSLEQALEICSGEEEVFIIGGASIYALSLPLATHLEITHIHHNFDKADTFFPPLNLNDWHLTESIRIDNDIQSPYPYTFATYSRK